jgi:hypothetical protein
MVSGMELLLKRARNTPGTNPLLKNSTVPGVFLDHPAIPFL